MTRRVEILNYKNGQKYPSGETGNFISYGLDYAIEGEGVGNFSTAIIEMDDGTVRNIYVERIKFLQQPSDQEKLIIHSITPVLNHCGNSYINAATQEWLEMAKKIGIYHGPVTGNVADVLGEWEYWLENNGGLPDLQNKSNKP